MKLWQHYPLWDSHLGRIELGLDIRNVPFDDGYLLGMAERSADALGAMAALESGYTSNPDEDRMVGHYWLRAPELAPAASVTEAIKKMRSDVWDFANSVRGGDLRGADGTFTDVIHIGIGGSSLGPRLLRDAHSRSAGQLTLHMLDNADPDTVGELLQSQAGRLDRTLVVVASKSGHTPTPHRLLSEVREAYVRAGIDFARHAIAITTEGSQLDSEAITDRWLGRFPSWDWVGGRTSITAAAGLLPAALVGVDVDRLLEGAAEMDRVTRDSDFKRNPAMLLALTWYRVGDGRGLRDLVILPYRDRLAGLTRYLQQLIMESVGKSLDRSGRLVQQGLSVYGNVGEPDQHAIMQQLRDGADKALVVFIGAHTSDGTKPSGRTTLDDHLFANLLSARDALVERGRPCLTIMVDRFSVCALGALIALFERAIGLYAELINVNAYHQPGVVTSSATSVLDLQEKMLSFLYRIDRPQTVAAIAAHVGVPPDAANDVLDHLVRTGQRVVCRSGDGDPRYHAPSATVSSAPNNDPT